EASRDRRVKSHIMGVVSILPAGLGPANTIRDESRRAFLADNLLIKLPKWAGGYWPPPGTDKSFTRHPQGPTGIRVTSTGGTASTYPASRSQTSCLKSHRGYTCWHALPLGCLP